MSIATDDGKQSETSSSSLQGSQPCRHFEFHEILQATHEFDESLVIGHGGFGKVYKGNVKNGSSLVVAAIKRLDSMSNQGETEFWAEVEMLSKLRHCNLVSLFGYCNYGKEMILVYEYMPNGTLEDHLHKLRTPLSWLQQLNICIGSARGLHYLHTGTGTEVGVIHRDVKTSNILLNESLAAKISDFGLSKVGPTNQPSTYVNTLVKGTFGYLDPNYYATGKLTRKSDVYAFGVVLLEVLCRKRAVDSSLDEEQWNLAIWAQESIRDGKLKQIIDSQIRGQISPKCLKEFVQIIERCLHNNPKQRSTMAEVVVSLESILTLQEKFNNSLQSTGIKIFDRMVDMIPFPSNRENSAQGGSKLTSNTKGNSSSAGNNTREVPADYRSQSLKEFKFADLKRATSNFSQDLLLDEGDTGRVFLGWVDKNILVPPTQGFETAVAVKWLRERNIEGSAEWHWQVLVKMFGHLAHPNIVSPLGYCNDKKGGHLLVYEYMPNQSLHSYLYPEAPDTVEPLSWGTRLSIMIGVAEGLAYLHASYVTYLGVRSSNVLLDQDFNAKLEDIESAKSCHQHTILDHERTTQFIDDVGYLDPRYLQSGRITMKTDIYAFGVLLLQTLTGLQVYDIKRRPGGQQYLVSVARPILAKGELKKIIDPRLEQNYPEEGAFKCATLALRCVAYEPKDRPLIDEVLQILKQIHTDKR